MTNLQMVIILGFVSICLVLFVGLYLYSNYYYLGYRRGKKIARRFGEIIIERLEKEKDEDIFQLIKKEVFRLVAKPLKVENADESISEFMEKINKLEKEKEKKFSEIDQKLIGKIRGLEEDYRLGLSYIQKMKDTSELEKADLISKKDKLEKEIKQKETELAEEMILCEKHKKEQKLLCKLLNSLNGIKDFIINFIKKIPKEGLSLLLLLAILILMLADFVIGRTYIQEIFQQKLNQSWGVERMGYLFLINGISIILFFVFFIVMEIVSNFLSESKNAAMRNLKFILSSFVMLVGLIGLILLFLSRLIQRNPSLEFIFVNLGLILIWFLLVFVCSYLLSLVRNNETGLNSILTLIGIPFLPVFFIVYLFFSVLFFIEYIGRHIGKEFSFGSQKITIFKNELIELKKELNGIGMKIVENFNYNEQLARLNDRKFNLAGTLEEDFKLEKNRIEYDTELEIKKLQDFINEINKVRGSFKEGCDQAAISGFKFKTASTK